MIDLQAFAGLASIPLDGFVDKPTTLTPGQQEAINMLWTSADDLTKIGVWECTTGHFTADRTAGGEYCHIISGSATVSNADGSAARDIGPGICWCCRRGGLASGWCMSRCGSCLLSVNLLDG